MTQEYLKVKRLTATAKLPEKAYFNDAGWDLFSDENDIVLGPGEPIIISTGIAVAVPENYYGRIAEKSGLASKGLQVGGGVVDEKYRGCINVICRNVSKQSLTIRKGDKIAQLIVTRISHCSLIEVDGFDETERGDKGFGSSGR